ncbi:MAG: hypothetical protein HQL07_00640 [Nitrospirae bacterium]|nr:hypothetical protein [Magnetococcales bacterium]
MTNNKYDCPKCNSDNTQRYDGIHNSQEVHLGVGVGGGHVVGGVGVTQKLNQKMFAPPENKNVNLGCAVSLFPVGLLFFIPKEASGNFTAIVFFLSSIAVFLLFRGSEMFKRNKQLHEDAIAEWKSKMYCHRCGNTFITPDI